jgi:hypothetical protein
MNIDRVRPDNAALSRSGQVRRGLDLTVSDQGVRQNLLEVLRQRAQKAPVVQVTSSPELQRLLSAEETQALHQAFVAPPQEERLTGVYTLRGQKGQARPAGQLGGLVDLMG